MCYFLLKPLEHPFSFCEMNYKFSQSASKDGGLYACFWLKPSMDENIVYCQWKLNVFDVNEQILVEQIRIYFGSLRNWQKGKTKGRKIPVFFVFKEWKRQCSNTHNRLFCPFPRAVTWLLGWSWNGQEQRDWKSTANNIPNGVALRDISAVAWECVLGTCKTSDASACTHNHLCI